MGIFIQKGDAQNLINNGCKLVAEGANMPSTLEATKLFLEAKVLYGPAKAANAGGVATSGLEMAQNSARLTWTREEVDKRLHDIMKAIHKNCFETAETYGTPGNLVNGANIGGFIKVANRHAGPGTGVADWVVRAFRPAFPNPDEVVTTGWAPAHTELLWRIQSCDKLS